MGYAFQPSQSLAMPAAASIGEWTALSKAVSDVLVADLESLTPQVRPRSVTQINEEFFRPT